MKVKPTIASKTFPVLLALLAIVALISCSPKEQVAKYNHSFKPGEIWVDTDSVHINAHGGGILYYNNTYYWFGEFKTAGKGGNSAQVGVSCYSSTDLYNWKNEGIALPVSNEAGSDIEKGAVIERPKVIYNEMTGKFVMWFHLELKGQGYGAARTALAVSDKATGPYTFVKSLRPNAQEWPVDYSEELKTKEYDPELKWWTPDWYKAIDEGMFLQREFEGGQMARDMQLFVDDDGKAYHIHASEDNLTLHISELTDDYQDFTGKYIRIFPAGHNEAPALFKKDGTYYLMASGCTGWDPNAARLFEAKSIWGPWESMGNPCVGEDADLTFHSQSTYILPVQGKEDAFIYMGDRWTPKNPIDGRYIWLPIQFVAGKPTIKWAEDWDLSVFDN
ncbi:glycoside hydrolase family 43 protein [Mangrovibacterium lignilyticum]|uniref:glycoside hydrolase family 43 protein n=1 Tax=Mangrovibacterium lignilyticum TaxID=2668052 RepID=UPI0013D6A03B|nr:glycoside hydrolase family 43 protein [Mangrovibacterium lignilyticum]